LIAKALGDAGDGNTIFKLLFSIKCSCYLWVFFLQKL
jgi:hypothetical protein